MIGDKIKERRIELGLKQVEVSKATGIKITTLSNYENNVSTPSEQNLYKLMETLKCDANYLFEWEEEEKINLSYAEKQKIIKYRELDNSGKRAVDSILDIEYDRCTTPPEETEVIYLSKSILRASAGTGNWLDEQQLVTVAVVNTPTARKANLVIEVDGDSMEPLYNNGDNVLVSTTAEVCIGDVGIFIVDGNGYIKKLGENRLISVNPEYDDIFPTEYSDFRCVGKVLGKAEISE